MIHPFDCYVDKTGKVYATRQPEFDESHVGYDIRKNVNRIAQFQTGSIQYDLQLIFDNQDLYSILKEKRYSKNPDSSRMKAALDAIRLSRVDDENNPLDSLIPNEVIYKYLTDRVEGIDFLWNHYVPSEKKREYEELIWPIFCDVMEIERSQIHIDEKLLESLLQREDLSATDSKFLKHIRGVTENGFASTKITPVGSKTWRLNTEGGLRCMAIPHGPCRQVVSSRFTGGLIYSLDFNAIDFRSIVQSINDPRLNAFYEGKEDFHVETTKLLYPNPTKDERNLVKLVTYSSLYGSSVGGLEKSTGLERSDLEAKLKILDEHFKEIHTFRDGLVKTAQEKGFIVTPAKHTVPVHEGDHAGKILGLYAQTYSSHILNKTIHYVIGLIRRLKMKSRLIFPVHDEIILDVHPEEFALVESMRNLITKKIGYSMKIKSGANYDAATQ